MSNQSFADLGVSAAVCSVLEELGRTEPFAVQKLVIADVLAGRDVLAKSPTGSGKTLAFGVPLVDRIKADGARPSALILAPTRELALQIVNELYPIAHARALKICAVYGGAGITKQAREAPKSHIIVATPGRLEDLLQRNAFSLDRVRMLVLDEADRMLDMGFRPPIDRIVAQCPPKRQTLFFSATLDGDAGRVALEYTNDPVTHEHAPPQRPAHEMEHRFVAVDGDRRVNALIDELRADRERALVFVRTKRGADRLVKKLGAQGVNAVAMHGNKTQGQRERALAQFTKGHVDTLVATDVAARGLDVTGISHVINFDAPEDREGYVHRTGRTARAGRTGIGITFVGVDQAADVEKIANALKLDREFALTGLAGSRQTATGSGQRRSNGRHGGGGGGGSRHGGPRNGSPRNGSPRNGSARKGSGSSNGGTPRTVASAGRRRGR
jgi:superfamily II DNA/RNA helicase